MDPDREFVVPEMSHHSRCHRTSVGRHFQFVFHTPNGDKISTGMYDTRIHDNTAVSWLWNIVRDEIDHPIDYVHLVIGGRKYSFIVRFTEQDGTLLQDLRLELVQGKVLGIDADLPITVIFLHCKRGALFNIDNEDDD